MRDEYTFITYIKSRVVFILLSIFLCALVTFILNACSVSKAIIKLIVLCILVIQLLQLIYEYVRNIKYWKFLSDCNDVNLNSITLIEEPKELKARISYNYIENLSINTRDKLNELSLSNSEYRDFVESWVHEIKTPLAGVSLILANHPSEENRQILSEINKTKTYVEQALYYARVGSVDRDYSVSNIKLAKLVNSSIKSRMHMLIETNTKVVTNNLDHEVLCDSKWIEFILGQIIDNAIKYKDDSKEQPVLSFDYEVENEGSAREVKYLTITDNGVGIDSKDIRRVFDKGFVGSNGRGFDKEKSTGIGLYLVSEMCKKMGVSIALSSKKGEYTQVKLGFEVLSK